MKGLKTGGRQKGTPNKSTEELKQLAAELGLSPAKFLLLVMKGDLRDFGYVFPDDQIYDPQHDRDGENLVMDKSVRAQLPKHMIPLYMRASAAESLMPYFEAKRKSIEISSGDPEDPPQFIINLTPKSGGEN